MRKCLAAAWRTNRKPPCNGCFICFEICLLPTLPQRARAPAGLLSSCHQPGSLPPFSQFIQNGTKGHESTDRKQKTRSSTPRPEALNAGRVSGWTPCGAQRATLPLSCCKGIHCKASASFPIKSHQGHTSQLAVSAHHLEAAQVQYVFPPPLASGLRQTLHTSLL